MNWRLVLCVVALLLLQPLSASAGDCYLTSAYGVGFYTKIDTRHEEKLFREYREEIMGIPLMVGTVGGIQKDGKSSPYHFGVGCHVSRYVSLEADYRKNFMASVRTNVAFRAEAGAESYQTRDLVLVRFAELEGWGMGIVFKWPFTERTTGTMRLAMLHGELRTGIRLPIEVKGKQIAVVAEEKDTALFGGPGLIYQLTSNHAVGIEYTHYGKGTYAGFLRLNVRL